MSSNFSGKTTCRLLRANNVNLIFKRPVVRIPWMVLLIRLLVNDKSYPRARRGGGHRNDDECYHSSDLQNDTKTPKRPQQNKINADRVWVCWRFRGEKFLEIKMSLVDYASSDDDDDVVPEKLADHEKASQKL